MTVRLFVIFLLPLINPVRGFSRAKIFSNYEDWAHVLMNECVLDSPCFAHASAAIAPLHLAIRMYELGQSKYDKALDMVTKEKAARALSKYVPELSSSTLNLGKTIFGLHYFRPYSLLITIFFLRRLCRLPRRPGHPRNSFFQKLKLMIPLN